MHPCSLVDLWAGSQPEELPVWKLFVPFFFWTLGMTLAGGGLRLASTLWDSGIAGRGLLPSGRRHYHSFKRLYETSSNEAKVLPQIL